MQPKLYFHTLFHSITLRAAWAANYDVTYVNDTFTEITLDQGRSWGSPEIELNWFICQRLPPPLNFPNLFTYGEEEKKYAIRFKG